MEITNEIKTKVFAQYYGQKHTLMASMSDGEIEDRGIFDMDGDSLSLCYESGYEIKLILKPLSEISDEDAIEVALRMNFHPSEAALNGRNFVKRAFTDLTRVGFEFHPMNCVMNYQFLQSRGYDLPQYLLGGKTLHEAGLAIYPKDI